MHIKEYLNRSPLSKWSVNFPSLSLYGVYKLVAIVVDEIRIQNEPCNLKVNRFCIFMFQYSETQIKHLENWQ